MFTPQIVNTNISVSLIYFKSSFRILHFVWSFRFLSIAPEEESIPQSIIYNDNLAVSREPDHWYIFLCLHFHILLFIGSICFILLTKYVASNMGYSFTVWIDVFGRDSADETLVTVRRGGYNFPLFKQDSVVSAKIVFCWIGEFHRTTFGRVYL